MTKEQRIESAEQFVRRVLADTFKQQADADTIRAVAVKVTEAVELKSKAA
jgi:hypothetical protein